MFLSLTYNLKEAELDLKRFNLEVDSIHNNSTDKVITFNSDFKSNDVRNYIRFSQSVRYIGYITSFYKNLQELKKSDMESFFDFLDKFDLDISKISLTYKFIKETEKHDRVEFRNEISDILSSKFTDINLTYSDTKVNLGIIVLEDGFYFTINIANIDLEKRVYKIFLTNQSLKPSFTHLCNLKLINSLKESFDDSDLNILNLFSSDGIFSIELSILKNSIDFRKLKREKIFYETLFENNDWSDDLDNLDISDYEIYAVDDKMAYLKNAEKNAKIVRVKDINFTREILKYTDFKYGESPMHGCISYPPLYSKRDGEKYLTKIVKETFFQLEFVLKKNGIFVVIFKTELKDDVKKIAKKFNFNLLEEKDIFFGNLNLTLFSFKNMKLDKKEAKKIDEEML